MSEEMRFADDKKARVRITLAKYYGLDGESWTKEEIADHLNIAERTVIKYLNSDEAKDIERILDQREAQTRMDIIENLHTTLDELNEIEDELRNHKKPVPSYYDTKQVSVNLSEIDIEGLDIEDADAEVDIDVPVPIDYHEVTDTEELTDVWREKRLVMEQMSDILGLDKPKQIEATSEAEINVKHWDMDDGGDLPEQDVVDVESEVIDEPDLSDEK